MALNSAPHGEKSSIKGYSFHRWRGWWSKYRPTFLEKRGRHKPWSHHTSPNSSPPQSGSKWHIPTNKGYSVRPHREFENPINTKISSILENTPAPQDGLILWLHPSRKLKKKPKTLKQNKEDAARACVQSVKIPQMSPWRWWMKLNNSPRQCASSLLTCPRLFPHACLLFQTSCTAYSIEDSPQHCPPCNFPSPCRWNPEPDALGWSLPKLQSA